jgi:glycosyltransferase involved in cell wall biosynthesis
MSGIHLSVVAPLFDEEENVRPLVAAVRTALEARDDWEFVLVDDGSRDGTAAAIEEMAQKDKRVHLVLLARNYGQTAALQAGLDHARGEVIVTLDGDLQNDPADIPRLIAKLEEGYDVVTGYRERRKDRWLTRKVPSWVANRLIRWITGVPIRDNGCSLKAYRREVVERLHLYSDLHRFITAVAAATAGARITEVPVRHHARRRGESKYGLSRTVKVLADLLTITMIRSFRERPLVMFGLGATAAALVALLFAGAALVSLTTFQAQKAQAFVLPGATLLWLELAGFLLMLGLIGEVALREKRNGADDVPIVHEEV